MKQFKRYWRATRDLRQGDMLMFAVVLVAMGIVLVALMPPEFWDLRWIPAAWGIVTRAWGW